MFKVSLLFTPVRLGASLDQPDGVLPELLEGLHGLSNLVHDHYFLASGM